MIDSLFNVLKEKIFNYPFSKHLMFFTSSSACSFILWITVNHFSLPVPQRRQWSLPNPTRTVLHACLFSPENPLHLALSSYLPAIDLILFIFYVLFSLGHLQGCAKVHVPPVGQAQRSPSPSCGECSRVLAWAALIFTLPQKGREEGKDPPRTRFAVSGLSAASMLSFFLW